MGCFSNQDFDCTNLTIVLAFVVSNIHFNKFVSASSGHLPKWIFETTYGDNQLKKIIGE